MDQAMLPEKAQQAAENKARAFAANVANVRRKANDAIKEGTAAHAVDSAGKARGKPWAACRAGAAAQELLRRRRRRVRRRNLL